MTRRAFKPHPYQRHIIRHMLEVPRGNVWAGMGLGKTVSALTAADALFMTGDLTRPILVLAPLRVARNTWPAEAQKWDHLRHIEVEAIVGAPKEREAVLQRALRTGNASVYTINYDNLPWLVKRLEELRRPWPFGMVIADESTRLKSFRTRQGGTRTKALAQYAHKGVDRWANLTGTPSPNGLEDLWGQNWFVDAGARLGRSFSAFQQRWFQAVPTGALGFTKTVPLAHAQAQIQEAVADVSLSLDARDWFDLKEPISRTVQVDLPAKARALYRQMEREMFMQIEGHDVEAFNAAAKSQKCIAAGTELLTDSGWKPIEDFRQGDRVWDGVDWVNVYKLACNGYMPTVNCHGVYMTPDHKVLTNSGWQTAEDINHGKESGRFDRASVRLPDDLASCRFDEDETTQKGTMGSAVRMREGCYPYRKQSSVSHEGAEEVLRLPSRRDAYRCLGEPRYVETTHLLRLGQHQITLRESEGQGFSELRRAWHHGLRRVAGFLRNILGGHGSGLRGGTFFGQGRQRERVRAGQLSMGDSTRTDEQHAIQRLVRHPSGENDRIPSSPALRSEKGDPGCSAEKGLEHREGVRVVYDLVNAGPRHRFTVRGSDGEPLIVHNCLQIASGCAYVDPAATHDEQPAARQWVEIHDAKLQALESIVQEAAGMPVLVAYHFKSDLARLLKAFPRGRWLGSDPQTEADWNAGKIPILFAHPKSAGHGLNLQDGGNILAFFSHDWNLEEYQQIIERIGPTRQRQAGHDRPVYLYHIVAADTIDEIVMQRRESKREVQDLLLEAMRKRA